MMNRLFYFAAIVLFSTLIVSCNSNKNNSGSQASQKSTKVGQPSNETPDSHNIDIKTNGTVPSKSIGQKKQQPK